MAMLAIPLVALVASNRNLGGAAGADVLCEEAEAFQYAWLQGDLQRAKQFVCDAHQGRLKDWAGPRRAALVAGFGREFDAQVISVEIVEQSAAVAVIRVRFVVGGREQLTFQDWKMIGSKWAICLD